MRGLFTLSVLTCLVAIPGAALAGPCTDRIAAIEKTLSSRDAGSGPTSTGSASTAPAPGTEATAAMNATVGNTATSAADVRQQTQGGATASQAATMNDPKLLSDKVAEAKAADAAGDSAGCTKALDEAETMM
ncbi:hypothetical protein FHS85_004035 [Rhodoligotrophos appendicifer]|uniref:hypothetical protein n=1 Tax=Rhodoligotrophos appendicifer TaxID=987056 RepID=UPI001FEBFC16|nr:hypothetical protein [Rhodoligotrophos appendicifer]